MSASSTRPDAQLGHLGLAPLVCLLDALRVDAPVENQPFQREPADLAPYRIETGQQDGFWSVVDDEVDAGHRLERADVPALTADNPALHLVAGQMQDGHDRLGGLFGGDPLDRQRHNLPGPYLTVCPCLLLDIPDGEGRFALGLVLDT